MTTEPRKKIMIADDAGPVVVLCVNGCRDRISREGANNGEAARASSPRGFDLLVVDYKMPGMTASGPRAGA